MAVELATAYVSVMPSMRGFQTAVNKELAGVEKSAQQTGRRAGGLMSGAVGTALKTGGVAAAAGVGTLMATALGKGFSRLKDIDQAQSKLRGLGHSAQSITTIMESANAAVKGTAFGLGEAADTAAAAVAAGISPGDQLTTVLKNVADAATIAGVPMNEMGLIFNKVAASGKLQGDELNQLMERGIPILSLLGKTTGKTAAEVRQMVSDGKVDFETFRRSMEQGMGGAALESGKTFQGALNNAMAALGRLGAAVLGPVFERLPGILDGLTQKFDHFQKNILPGIQSKLSAVGNAFKSVGMWIKDNQTWIGPLAAGIAGIAAAWGAWTLALTVWRGVVTAGIAIQAAFNAVMAANPIGLIVLAIAGLVAGLTYFFTQTELGKRIWDSVWNGIKNTISAVWGFLSTNVFPAIGAAFQAIGAAATWLWQNAIVPAFNGVRSAASLLWSGVKTVFDWLRGGMQAVGNVMSAVWTNVIKPAWDALGNGIRWVWDSLIRPAFDAIKTAIGNVGNTFSTIAEGIRVAWDKIKEYARAPISFVINTVWNNGLLRVWDKLDDFLPIPKAPGPVAFAKGGPVPFGHGAQRGKDSVHALMMPGEHVWDVEDVKRAGGQSAMYGMRDAVMSGRPFAWTPQGVGPIGEGGPLPKFRDGGAVTAGAKLAASGGEGGLQPIGVLMKRLIHALWPSIKTIGGYRQDAYPEHPSGRALDVMVGSDKKTGDQVNQWAHANHPQFPLTHSIWQQSMWYPPNMRRQGMADRGSPTQNHMDHPHIWWEPQNVNPNVVPEGLVGFDGMTPQDKRNWLAEKAREVINNLLGGIKDAVLSRFPGGETVFQNLPKAFMDGTFGKLMDKAMSVVATLTNPGKWYDMGKDILGDVVKSTFHTVTGGLFRDQGGFIPNGMSVVRNETGKPEAVLNWQQLELIKAIMDKFKVDRSTALRKAGIDGNTGRQVRNPDSDAKAVADELKKNRQQGYESDSLKAKQDYEQAKLERRQSYDAEVRKLRAEYEAERISKQEYDRRKAELKRLHDESELAKKQEFERQKLSAKQQRDNQTTATPSVSGSEEPQLSPQAEYDKQRADSISSAFGNAAKSAVEGQMQDVFGIFSINDSPPLLAAYNQYVEDKKAYDEMRKRQSQFESGTGEYAQSSSSGSGGYVEPGNPYGPGGDVEFSTEQSKVQKVPEGPAGAPSITYNQSGGAEQWRPLAKWAIDYVKRGLNSAGPQVQAMVEQIGDESGGNPRAQNNWDINAQNGVPSGGLLQVIEPTFQAHRDKALPNDKFHPTANLVAALRYYVSRYGTDLTTRWGKGKGGYKLGGYTGNLGVNDVAGVVHGREYVMPAGPTRRNRAVLSAMHAGTDFVPAGSAGGMRDSVTYNISTARVEDAFHEARQQEDRRAAMGLSRWR